jgi:predicted O-linked N-acetylglucosamine transferase (SPINDLY family)
MIIPMAKVLMSKKKELVLQQLLGRAMELHRMGLLAEAEQHYLQVLEIKPRHVDAQHLLGVIRAQQGRLDEALELVGSAVRARPDSAMVLSDYGLVLHKLDRHEDAVASFDRALAIRPDHAAALSNRGNALSRLARHADALASYDGALRIRPDYPEALSNRGNALVALGRHEEALASYGRALAIRPQDADALRGRGSALCALERHEEALGSFRSALAIRSGDAGAHYDLANALALLRRYEEALAGYDAALAIRPDDAQAFANRGNALLQLNRHEEALASYERALAIRPDDGPALNNRGTALKGLKRYEAALASYDQALVISPDFADAAYNRANVLKEMKRYDEALLAYDGARSIRPDHADAYGLIDAALAVCDWKRSGPLAAELAARIEAGAPFTPFALLGFSDDPRLHLKCATNYIADRVPSRHRRMPAVARRDKIRIGYLSGDFHEHATAYLIAGLIEQHDRTRFEVLGISFGRDDDSDMRRRLVKAFDQFHDLQVMSDSTAAAHLDGLALDVAVDLKGYTQGCRPELLGGRAAPIQVNYLGYPGTMGADFIDYVIADATTVPFDQHDRGSSPVAARGRIAGAWLCVLLLQQQLQDHAAGLPDLDASPTQRARQCAVAAGRQYRCAGQSAPGGAGAGCRPRAARLCWTADACGTPRAPSVGGPVP